MTRLKLGIAAVTTALLLMVGFSAAAQATGVRLAWGSGGSAIAPVNSNTTVGEQNAGVSPFAVKNVGGGTWNYGSQVGFWPPKTCWSNYKHNSRNHSSTAIMGKINATVFASAGRWSQSTVGGGLGYTCYAKWWRA